MVNSAMIFHGEEKTSCMIVLRLVEGVLIMDLLLPGRFSGERNAVGPQGLRRSQVHGEHIFFILVFVFSVKLSTTKVEGHITKLYNNT